MKRILVAVDGSDHARRAIGLASDIAQKYDGELILVHVIDDKPLSDSARHLADVEFAEALAKQHWVNPEPVAGDRYQALGKFLKEQDSRVTTIKQLLGQKSSTAPRTRLARMAPSRSPRWSRAAIRRVPFSRPAMNAAPTSSSSAAAASAASSR